MPGLKSKTIKSIIHRKMRAWWDSVDDLKLREKLEQGTIVTGGALVSMLLGEEVRDYDVYLRDHDLALQVALYYVARFKPKKRSGIPVSLDVLDTFDRIKIVVKSAGVASEGGTDKPYQYFEGRPDDEGGEYVDEVIQDPERIEDAHEETETAALNTVGKPGSKEQPKFRPVFLTTNAITLSDKVQLVVRFFGEPDKIHENYDFVHCTSYWTSWDNALVLRPAALEAIIAKELRYVGSRYPICSLVRVRKFIERGWRINAGQILKMAMQISELGLKDPAILEDQLTGVDTAYFAQLIQRLKERDPDKIDTAYLVEIVDKIF